MEDALFFVTFSHSVRRFKKNKKRRNLNFKFFGKRERMAYDSKASLSVFSSAVLFKHFKVLYLSILYQKKYLFLVVKLVKIY